MVACCVVCLCFMGHCCVLSRPATIVPVNRIFNRFDVNVLFYLECFCAHVPVTPTCDGAGAMSGTQLIRLALPLSPWLHQRL